MKLHHLRNATFIIESKQHFILVDPMLGEKGTASPLSYFRFRPLRNPLVELPSNAQQLLDKVTHCLITHLHPDHLDNLGIAFLKDRNIPIVCSVLDQKKLLKKGLNIELALTNDDPQSYLDGKIAGIKGVHGYGFIKRIAGNVMGLYLDLPDEKSIYISSDTVYTTYVAHALKSFKPDITVMAAGMAQLDIGDLLLMNKEDVVKFVKESPGKVVANHLEALNHCPNTRTNLLQLLKENRLQEKVNIPKDGETIEY